MTNNVIEEVAAWHKAVTPAPDYQTVQTSLGTHFSLMTEMLNELKGQCATSERTILKARHAMSSLANLFNSGSGKAMIGNDEALLHNICEQVVSLVGVCHTMHYDIVPAMAEMSGSNNTMLTNGKADYFPNGKLRVAPSYVPPSLDIFIG